MLRLEPVTERDQEKGVGYFAMHSTSASKVGLGTQLSSFLGAASATGFGDATDDSGCTWAC